MPEMSSLKRTIDLPEDWIIARVISVFTNKGYALCDSERKFFSDDETITFSLKGVWREEDNPVPGMFIQVKVHGQQGRGEYEGRIVLRAHEARIARTFNLSENNG